MVARMNWQEEVAGGSMPLDLTVDPIHTGNMSFPADWVELTGGGTLTYLDGSGETQTITNPVVGYVSRSVGGFHKLVSLSGASPNLVRCGTGAGPQATGPQGATGSTGATGAAGYVSKATGQVLNGSGVLAVVNASVTSTSEIILQNENATGVLELTRTAGTGFTVTSSVGASDSAKTFAYEIVAYS